MEAPSPSTVSETLRDLLADHSLDTTMEREWVVPNGRLPAIRATWHPRETSGRLDVQVLLDHGRIIDECFAGSGAGAPGFADALQNFMVNSLHVLLSALWDVSDDQQVAFEKWTLGGRQFTAYIGNIGTRASAGIHVKHPAGLFETIQHLICRENLSGDTHWFRVFFCNVSGQHTYEALQDNEPWEAGVAGLKGIAWPEASGYYSFRNFIVLRSS